MKKRMMTWLLVLLAALTLTVPSFAEQTEDDLLIYDAAELLNEDEWLELELVLSMSSTPLRSSPMPKS